MSEIMRKHVANRLAFLGVVAWISVCLLFAGMYPELHRRFSAIWIVSGLLGLVAAVGLAEVVKREMRQQARMLEVFKTEAYTDSLTRLPNRRALDECMATHLRLADRNELPLAMIMVDLDFFKKYNDTHGHGAGDDLLRLVAIILQDSFRDTDMVARYGGEEFVAVLPQTELHSAIRVARRLRESIERRTKEESPIGQQVTISLGLTMAKSGDTVDSWLTRADAALYVAKNSGRNCGFFEDENGCHRLDGRAEQGGADSDASESDSDDTPDFPNNISLVG